MLAVFVARRARGAGVSGLMREPGTAILALLLALIGAFALRYAPYGGPTSWGPRLLLPWIPALGLLFVAAYPGEASRAVASALATRRRFAAVLVAIVALGLSSLIVTVDSSRWGRAYPGIFADRRELVIRPWAPDSVSSTGALLSRAARTARL